MQRKPTVAAALCLSAALTTAARADLKVVSSTTINSPQMAAQMKTMPPEQRAMMQRMGLGGTTVVTMYFRGQKSRTDTQAVSILTDAAAKTMTVVDRTARTYSTRPYNPAQTAQQAGGATASVKDAGPGKVVMGHPTRHYKLTSAGGVAGAMSGDLFAATDLPRPPIPTVAGGPAAAVMAQMQKIKGLPLLTTLTVPSSPIGAMTIRQVVTSVSKTPLAASLFVIPAGYAKGQPGAGMPGMMGGGRSR